MFKKTLIIDYKNGVIKEVHCFTESGAIRKLKKREKYFRKKNMNVKMEILDYPPPKIRYQ